jgi:hypothetical protein
LRELALFAAKNALATRFESKIAWQASGQYSCVAPICSAVPSAAWRLLGLARRRRLPAEQASRGQRQKSLARCLMPRLAEPDTWAASVLVDELDAGFLKGTADS